MKLVIMYHESTVFDSLQHGASDKSFQHIIPESKKRNDSPIEKWFK